MKTLFLSFFVALFCAGQAFGQSYLIPKYLKPSSGYVIHQKTNEIVITIDDGPTRGVTGPILDALKRYGVKATFFVVGSRVKRNPTLMKRMLQEGHIVANHTYTHPKSMRQLSNQSIISELTRTHEVIKPYTYNGNYYYFRAPGGVWAPFVADAANRTYFARDMKGPILWDIGGSIKRSQNGTIISAADWACWSRGYSVAQCLQGYINETRKKRGGVVLFHDLNKKSVPLIRDYIRHFATTNNSFRFVTLDQVRL